MKTSTSVRQVRAKIRWLVDFLSVIRQTAVETDTDVSVGQATLVSTVLLTSTSVLVVHVKMGSAPSSWGRIAVIAA